MFTVTHEKFVTLRKRALGEGLIQTFEDSRYLASRDSATGDVLVKDPHGSATRLTFDQYGLIGGVISPLGRYWWNQNDSRAKVLSTGGIPNERKSVRQSPSPSGPGPIYGCARRSSAARRLRLVRSRPSGVQRCL